MSDHSPIGQGHGIAGRFAGLPDTYSNLSTSRIVLLPIPFDRTTTYQQGCDKGPSAIIEASRNLELYDIETETEIYKQGIYTAPPIETETSTEMLSMGYEQTKLYLGKKKCSIAIGGEHSISYGPVRAYAEHYKELTILQLDAHADLQPHYEDNPWSHASVMKRIQELPQVTKIISVGIRSLSAEELPYVVAASTFYAHTLDLSGQWIEKVLAQLSGNVYITFDLDVFDSSLMPSTGTPEPGGLSWNQVMSLLRQVCKRSRVVGFDVVELLPSSTNVAPDYLAAKLIYKLLSYNQHNL